MKNYVLLLIMLLCQSMATLPTDKKIDELPRSTSSPSNENPFLKTLTFPLLKKLNLNFAAGETLPAQKIKFLGKMASLEDLKIAGGVNNDNIKALIDALAKQPNLKKLTLRSNHNQLIPEKLKVISNLTNLQVLNLSDNELKGLPQNFVMLTKLHTLNLESNEIIELPKNFGNLPKLQKLNLRRNFLLTLLPPSFLKLKNLRTLYIAALSGPKLNPEAITILKTLQSHLPKLQFQ